MNYCLQLHVPNTEHRPKPPSCLQRGRIQGNLGEETKRQQNYSRMVASSIDVLSTLT
jgi:hypothetical protein